MHLSKSFLRNPMMILMVIWLLLPGCDKDRTSNELKGCCDEPSINATVGSGHVYVPNVFTPNADGINDYLTVAADDSIVIIRSFQVKNKAGQTVFQVEDLIPNDPSRGWDGTIDGTYQNGVYSIIIQVQAGDGTVATLEGKVCNFRCLDSNTGDPISKEGCQFPSQVQNGVFSPTLPSNESNDCFD